MIRIFSLVFFIFFVYYDTAKSSPKDKILENLSNLQNLSFNFTQTINGKDEGGNCIIEYPRKLFCKYKLKFNKIIVSDGDYLVIKSDKNNQFYKYRLDDTLLKYLLDKKFISKKIKDLGVKLIDEKFYLLNLEENGQIINIYFNFESFDLIGWQTEDLYQNLSVTYIYNLKKNSNIKKKLFYLPNIVN